MRRWCRRCCRELHHELSGASVLGLDRSTDDHSNYDDHKYNSAETTNDVSLVTVLEKKGLDLLHLSHCIISFCPTSLSNLPLNLVEEPGLC